MGSQKYSEIKKDLINYFGLSIGILGALLSIVALIPDSYFGGSQASPGSKMIIVLILLGLEAIMLSFILLYCVNKFLNKDLQELNRRQEEIKLMEMLYQDKIKLLEMLPRSVRLSSEEWTFELQDKGNVKITRYIKARNIGTETLPYLRIYMLYDIYEPGKKELFTPKITSLSIDGKEQDCRDPYRYYKESGLIIKQNLNDIDSEDETPEDYSLKGEGYTEVPFKDIGGLKAGEPVDIKIIHTQDGIFQKMDKGESAHVYVAFPTDILKIKILPPEGKRILDDVCDKSRQIQIKKMELEDPDLGAMFHAQAPTYTERSVEWIVEKPIIGNLYRVMFKTEQENHMNSSSNSEELVTVLMRIKDDRQSVNQNDKKA